MDAYSDFLRQLAEQRLADLRREATEERLARSLTAAQRAAGIGRGFSLRARFQRRAARRAAAGSMREVVPMPIEHRKTGEELRQSA